MTSTDESAGANRWRRILWGGLSAGTARAVGIGCNLLAVPVLLRVLGPEGFGVWAVLQAITLFVPALDFGTGFQLQNRITHALAVRAPAGLAHELRTVGWLITGVSVLLAGAALMLPASVWLSLFGVESPSLRTALGGWLGPLVALCCAHAPAVLGVRLATAQQRTWLIGATQSGISLLTFAVAITASYTAPTTGAVLAALLAVPVAINGALTLWLLRELAAGEAIFPPPTPAELRAVVRGGFPFLIPQILGSVRLTAPPLILASVLGAAAVTPFNLVQRLLNLVAQPAAWMIDPLWPAYADAAGRQDHAWIRRTFRVSLLLTLGLAIVPLLSALAWAPAFIAWWTHAEVASLPAALVLWLVLWQAGVVIAQACSVCLNGLGRLRGQMLYGPPTALAGLAGMAWIARDHGVGLAAAPAALATLLFSVPCTLLDVRQALRAPVAA